MSPKNSIIDSHIHLWPASTANEKGHAWMTPGMPLAKPQLLAEYSRAIQPSPAAESNNVNSLPVKGAIYVETDVRYSQPQTQAEEADVETWAAGPLNEIAFLRELVHDESSSSPQAPACLLALVPWAPVHLSPATLEQYLLKAESRAGVTTWERVKGFRFLLQALSLPEEFDRLVESDDFIANLRILGRRGFSFDVGVDQRSAGTWQLEGFAKVVERLRKDPDTAAPGADSKKPEKVVLILNHLCKPDFSTSQGEAGDDDEFARWSRALESMASYDATYMKLSGAFSELPEHVLDTKSAAEIAAHLQPWLVHVFRCFGPRRVMFGSDWPVCNVRGPVGESSWGLWREVVDCILRDPIYGLSEEDRVWVWRGTAAKAYRLE